MKIKDKLQFFNKFFQGSKRYFFSALGFPPDVREKVAAVYNFCRFIDDSVDEPDKAIMTFDEILLEYHRALNRKSSKNLIINQFVLIKNEKNIKDEWVEALFNSMRMDLNNTKYIELQDTLSYTYGVAEIIGLFMCKVLDLPENSYMTAKLLGRSAQWINFIRDIKEDSINGRVYFPQSDLKDFGLINLEFKTAKNNQEGFFKFIELQKNRYTKWVTEGEKGYNFIPKKLLKPIIYATELDKWKMRKISENPFIIFEKKIDPGYFQLIMYVFKSYYPIKNPFKILTNISKLIKSKVYLKSLQD